MRRFFFHCAIPHHERKDFSDLKPSGFVPRRYISLFLMRSPLPLHPPYNLTGKVGEPTDLTSLGLPFTEEEIKRAIHDLPSDKSPGPDGFPMKFFRRFWEIIGTDICAAIFSFQHAVRVNGELTNFFFHRRGLRQGDPLSPLLFNLVVDALQSFVQNAAPLTSGPIIIPPRALQFADDTIILLEALSRNLIIVREILANFAKLTGLHINDAKCLFVPVSISHSLLPAYSSILNCMPKQLPVTYLGLPLSIRKLKKIHYKPLIDAFQRKLDGWKAKFLSPAGRLVLVKSVLSALPLHYMQVLKLPSWLIHHLDSIRRRFFWKGTDKCLGGHCLVNWKQCCLPKRSGGLGILDLAVQNQALLLKWLWKLKTEPDATWTNFVQILYGSLDEQTLFANRFISNGLRDILSFRDFFLASLDSHSNDSVPLWRWSTTGVYSTSSAYSVLADPGVRLAHHSKLWKLKAPPRVQIFLWLLLMDKLLTQQNLNLRNWPAIEGCPCCPGVVLETSLHLFLQCPFARSIWDLIQHQFRLPMLHFTTDLTSFWLQNRIHLGTHWDTIWAAATWSVWKERNNRIFSLKAKSPVVLLRDISKLVCLWSNLA
ncbi:hypothetical protein LUZ61_016192 [Rhynchospora tenuis]|uniref:Reverse transcriptase domain-containing protein n=1 Tax=Rhynchospora tenuis TaxID=198213 RepID=A0AAD5Z524_9POAL|nr:hypothetical protein LUZ61_016192 [Rhynchospora tenuis]